MQMYGAFEGFPENHSALFELVSYNDPCLMALDCLVSGFLLLKTGVHLPKKKSAQKFQAGSYFKASMLLEG